MLIRSHDRGITTNSWLHSAHSFSFAGYYDSQHMGYSVLRAINQDIIAPQQGFGMHSHHNMEILTYVLSGTLQHKDSLGNESLIQANELQRMSAGSGIRHSEWNPSASEPCKLLQIWILPEMEGVAPSYQQAYFSNANHGIWQLLVSPNGENHSLSIRQSVRVYRAKIQPEQKIVYELDRGRCLWLQMISGKLIANENELYAGDGLGLQAKLSLTGIQEAEVLLFDLPS